MGVLVWFTCSDMELMREMSFWGPHPPKDGGLEICDHYLTIIPTMGVILTLLHGNFPDTASCQGCDTSQHSESQPEDFIYVAYKVIKHVTTNLKAHLSGDT